MDRTISLVRHRQAVHGAFDALRAQAARRIMQIITSISRRNPGKTVRFYADMGAWGVIIDDVLHEEGSSPFDRVDRVLRPLQNEFGGWDAIPTGSVDMLDGVVQDADDEFQHFLDQNG